MKTATYTISRNNACGQYMATITFTHNGRVWSTFAAPDLTEQRAIENALYLIRISRAKLA